MSDNKTTQINEKIEIPKMKLWSVWFFLFVLPTVIAIISFNYFKEEYLYFQETKILFESYEKVKNYNEIIIPETFLENQLTNIKKLKPDLSAKELKEKIDQIICGESLFCLFFDENSKNVENIKGNVPLKVSLNVPITFLKNQISILKNDLKNTSESQIKKYDETQIQMGATLQQLFKTASTITITKNKIAKNFSVIFGGELYFIFITFDEPSKNIAGFFAVLRGQDFSFHKMLETLHPSFPDMRIVYREIDINKTEKNLEKFHCGIKKSKEDNYLIAPTKPIFARHVLHGGSEKLITGYGNLFPFIEYRIPKEKYLEPLRRSSRQINYIALIIILFSSIYFLKVSLFGFKDNFTFKNKIMLLILIVSLFPFTLLIIGKYNIEEFDRSIAKISVLEHVETELRFISQELKQYLTDINNKLSEYNKGLSEILSKNEHDHSELFNLLTKIGEEIPLSSEHIYMLDKDIPNKLEDVFKDNEVIKSYPERKSKELVDEANDSLLKIMPLHLLSKLLVDKDREPAYLINLFGSTHLLNQINDVLTGSGNLIPFDQFITQTWYSLHKIRKTDEGGKIIGIYAAKFEPRPILDFYYTKKCSLAAKSINFKEEIGNYEINYAFLPIERSGSAPIWEKSGHITNDDKDRVLKDIQSGIINYGTKTIIKRRDHLIPHLAVATIKEKDNSKQKYFLIVLARVLAYLFLILYFANRLLDIMFVEPVMLLASNASAIARGGDEWKTEIKSGDEFEELNNSFKQLVTGLQERNILKSYVSEDAFSDLEESDNVKLLPGGEYLEATIVFSAIKDYDKLSSSMTPQESIKLLSKFMSIAEEATKKYGGSIDKIIGDTIMLVFRDNPNKESHGLRAAEASLELVEKAKSVGLPKLYTGIASGRVISGRIGSYSGKLDFTVIGNPVNSAARFKTESKNGTEETGIIISGTTVGLMKGRAIVKFLRRVDIKGKQRKYNIYELLGIRD